MNLGEDLNSFKFQKKHKYMAVRLNEVQRKYMLKVLGSLGITYVGTTPMNDIVRRFYVESLGTASDINSIADMETLWLIKEINTLLGTPESTYASDLWKQLNSLKGFKVARSIDENKIIFYLNA